MEEDAWHLTPGPHITCTYVYMHTHVNAQKIILKVTCSDWKPIFSLHH